MSEFENENQNNGINVNSSGEHRFILIYTSISACISIILCVTLILIATTMWPEFDWLTKTLSNLGNPAKCLESAPVINGGYFIGSLGIFPFILYMTYLVWSKTDENCAKLGFLFMCLSSLTVGALAIVTELMEAHITVSTIFFGTLGIGLLLISMSWLVRKDRRSYGIISFIVLLLAIGIWLINGLPDYTGIKFWAHDAIPEFFSVILYMIIIFTYVFKTWKQDAKPRETVDLKIVEVI